MAPKNIATGEVEGARSIPDPPIQRKAGKYLESPCSRRDLLIYEAPRFFSSAFIRMSELLYLALHVSMVLISGATLLFSDNLVVTGAMMVIVGLVLAACFYFDGCILSKVEGVLPIIGVTPTQLVKDGLLLDGQVPLKEIEKILIGVTFVAFVAKFGVLLAVEFTEQQPFAKVVSRLGKSRGFGKQLHSVLV